MQADKTKFKTIEAYFASLPPATKTVLKELRKIIKETAADAEEVISYNMPALKLNGMLVWYAGYKNHIGLYTKGTAIKNFEEALKPYKTSKGTIRFSLDEPLPLMLIKKIIQFRVKENLAAVKLKKK
jgi:uncharacterized protein YdhG (YjbR/CyaY superfamily)